MSFGHCEGFQWFCDCKQTLNQVLTFLKNTRTCVMPLCGIKHWKVYLPKFAFLWQRNAVSPWRWLSAQDVRLLDSGVLAFKTPPIRWQGEPSGCFARAPSLHWNKMNRHQFLATSIVWSTWLFYLEKNSLSKITPITVSPRQGQSAQKVFHLNRKPLAANGHCWLSKRAMLAFYFCWNCRTETWFIT